MKHYVKTFRKKIGNCSELLNSMSPLKLLFFVLCIALN